MLGSPPFGLVNVTFVWKKERRKTRSTMGRSGDAGEGRVPGDPSFIILSRRPHIAPTGYSIYIYISSVFALPTALIHIVFNPTIEIQCSIQFHSKIIELFLYLNMLVFSKTTIQQKQLIESVYVHGTRLKSLKEYITLSPYSPPPNTISPFLTYIRLSYQLYM